MLKRTAKISTFTIAFPMPMAAPEMNPAQIPHNLPPRNHITLVPGRAAGPPPGRAPSHGETGTGGAPRRDRQSGWIGHCPSMRSTETSWNLAAPIAVSTDMEQVTAPHGDGRPRPSLQRSGHGGCWRRSETERTPSCSAAGRQKEQRRGGDGPAKMPIMTPDSLRLQRRK